MHFVYGKLYATVMKRLDILAELMKRHLFNEKGSINLVLSLCYYYY